jgi:hypothetical protein
MNVQRSVIYTGEASPKRQLLQQDYAKAPPIGGSAYSADDGFGRGIPGELEWGDSLEIEI